MQPLSNAALPALSSDSSDDDTSTDPDAGERRARREAGKLRLERARRARERRAEERRERQRELAAVAAAPSCDENYEGACLDPDSPDYDCEGGSGDGPDYTNLVRVVGYDVHDLDRDGDGIACDA